MGAADKGVYTCNLHHHYCQVHQSIQIQLNVTKSGEEGAEELQHDHLDPPPTSYVWVVKECSDLSSKLTFCMWQPVVQFRNGWEVREDRNGG